MQHSIKFISNELEEMSILRKEQPLFSPTMFTQFVLDNKEKYNIIVNEYDMYVSTWYADDIKNDYLCRVV